jgi:hypothetical protein
MLVDVLWVLQPLLRNGEHAMRFLSTSFAFLFTLALVIPAFGGDAPFAGRYSDGTLAVDLSQADGAYAGTFTRGAQQFPALAHATTRGLEGTFNASGNSFPFTAALDADTLTLSTGGKTYALKRVSSLANPLAHPGPAPAGGDALAGYTVEVSTDYGKSLVTQKPNTASVRAALESTFPDLARYFGARPAIGSAYQDAKDPESGGATFSSNLDGHPVKGFISCKLHDGAATVAVVYGRTDAPKGELDKLMHPPAQTDPAAPAAVVSSDPKIPLKAYDFPDGTGTVGLADGWDTKAQTSIHTAVLTGPADQVVILGNSVTVSTPDSPTVKMMQHNQEMMQQMQARNARMGFKSAPPPSGPPVMIAPFTDPVDALKNLMPLFSKRSEFNHGPSISLDRIISSEETPTQLAGGKGANITYAFTRTLNGESSHFRAHLHLQICLLNSPTEWMWFATSMQAPDSTFDHDLPIMTAMARSLKMNEARAKELSDAENAQTRQMTAQMAQQSQQNLENNARQFQHDQDSRNRIYQEQHAAQMDGYARHNQQWQSDQLQKSRNNADFIETIKGTRTVYDTQTGTAGTADLNYVNGVVDSLNRAALDPNRFIQIPLRDEMYPVPPGR